MKKKSIVERLAELIVLIGALNWGLVGVFKFDLIHKIFGMGMVSQIIYIVVGLAGLYVLFFMWLFRTGDKPKKA